MAPWTGNSQAPDTACTLLPHGGMTRPARAEAIREHRRAHDTEPALRALLRLNDDLTAEHGLVRGILGLTEPERTGDSVRDAAIAALVPWRLNQEHIPLYAFCCSAEVGRVIS